MGNELFDSAQRILVERLRWEERARRLYTMRHDGLTRRDKTKSWQADSHSKTIDRAIRKDKPFWIGQVTAGNRLANFTALTQQVQQLSDAAANYYDFISHTQTKLLTEIDCAIDHMLLKGRGILKSTIDPIDQYAIVDEAIDPMFLLMPESAGGFEDADEWIHVRLMTVPAYKRLDARWDTSPETINKIRGSKEFQSLGIYQQQVQLREGITHTSNSNYILLFEHWTKTASGHDISYYSPNSPDLALRQTHQNPYKWNGKESVPFISFQMEIKEKGWYAPRGLGELLDVQEQLETAIENRWLDAMAIANTRIFTGQKEIQNMANLRLEDGQYIPGAISSVQMAPPALPWSEMLNYQRARSEEISQSPDSSSTAPDSKTGGKAITAAESNRIGALTQVGMNYAAEIFRRDLAKLHQHRWGLVCQFREREFAYYAASELNSLPEEALHDRYMIVPDGTPDGWNKQGRIQREVILMQTFANLPNANADYWVERAMRAVDGQAALQGFRGMNLKGADEYEAQANEIQLLTDNPPFPVQPQPQQDQPTRIKCMLDWMTAAHQAGRQVGPQQKMLLHQNLAARMQILKQQNPSAYKKISADIAQMEQATATPQAPGSPHLAGAGAAGLIPQAINPS